MQKYIFICLALITGLSTFQVASAQMDVITSESTDPRVGLAPGWQDAGEAILNLKHLANRPRPDEFRNPSDPGDFGFANADLAFSGSHVFLGGYNGLQVWDISDPADPTLKTSLVCPGGQGDVSIYGDLLFMSVEEMRGRLDCGTEGVRGPVSDERFRGVRIFDISDVEVPKQVAAVQTCRGSHTHTLVTDPGDAGTVYVYVSGTSPVRPNEEMAGCSSAAPDEDPNTSLFQIEVIRVPLAAPEEAAIVNAPRIFADLSTGAIDGLWEGGDHGEGTQMTAETDQCHDITVYPELGLAAGACSGNGILLDITDPENPKRIGEVSDPNFAYWHSATFSNDGDKLIFTDEWGGGVAARCRVTDRPEWGANALFTIEDRKLEHVGYYKMPAPQEASENCVAHNGSLIPVPGRDIMVQSWYQGGISIFDFTDPEEPVEIAFFDRGPMDTTFAVIGGYWSSYWYNGHIYGSEIGRGLDVFELEPSEYLSENEIAAARLVTEDAFNAQLQTRIVWPATYVVARAYLDQLERSGMDVDDVRAALDAAEAGTADGLADAAEIVEGWRSGADGIDAQRIDRLAETLRGI